MGVGCPVGSTGHHLTDAIQGQLSSASVGHCSIAAASESSPERCTLFACCCAAPRHFVPVPSEMTWGLLHAGAVRAKPA